MMLRKKNFMRDWKAHQMQNLGVKEYAGGSR